MIGRPAPTEAATYFFRYIDQVTGDDPVSYLEQQSAIALDRLSAISEADSLVRYAPGKWSVREVLNHVNDVERVFAGRLLWFARGLGDPMPSFEENQAAASIKSDAIPWPAHIEEFRHIRAATLSLIHHLPQKAWDQQGIASGNVCSVRALAWIIAGHLTHHMKLIDERYLPNKGM